jgi:hypothetical protein
MVDERVTHTYRLGIPTYRTGCPERTNWSLFKLWDFLPITTATVLTMHDHWSTPWPIFGGFMWTLCVGSVRVWRRGGECERRGWHEPYRPVDHLAAYRCWRCEVPLPGDTVLDRVAANVRPEQQAAYSDRR